jgi:hypothetical protein
MKEGEPSTQPERATERWEYKNQFEQYLVRLATEGGNSLEPIDRFPMRIELSPEWHEVHERMEIETRDGHERWTPIGYRKGFKDIHVPKTFSLWDVNLGIAQEYNIALYKGKTGEDLIRQYP